MKNNIDVSVIIPIFNVENYIADCAVSLFSQSLKENIEFIFINDSSSDRSMEILKQTLEKYPERKSQTIIVENPYNLGVGNSRLEGIKNASGKYIIHCDPDDKPEKQCYEKLLSKALKEKRDIVICDYYEEINSKKYYNKITHLNSISHFFNLVVTRKFHLALWNKLISKKIYEKITFPANLNMWEDLAFLMPVFLSNQNIGYVHEPLYTYIRRSSSITNVVTNKRVKSQIKGAEHVIDFINKNNLSDKINAKDMVRFKWNTKYNLLFPPNKENFKEWYLFFPEIKYAFINGNLTHFSKLTSLSLLFKSYFLIKLLSNISRTVK